MLHVITGATGLLGSHLAEQLRAEGARVRALVRPTSRTEFLDQLGVEKVVGDLSDLASLRRAVEGADVVYHAAAKVGDWGTRQEFLRETQQGTENLVAACQSVGVGRFVHVSSTSAYGHPPADAPPIDETWPLGERFWLWDDYTRTKIAAERAVWAAGQAGLPISIIRPSWLYGPRDRLSIARIDRSLKSGRVRLIGAGDNLMNTVYAGNVAEACRLAATRPEAVGQAFNITNDGQLTQRRYFELYAQALGHPAPTRHYPFAVAWTGAFLLEAAYRAVRSRRPPFITRYAVWLLGRNTFYSTEKAQRVLGWRPRVGYEEGIPLTVAWYRATAGRG